MAGDTSEAGAHERAIAKIWLQRQFSPEADRGQSAADAVAAEGSTDRRAESSDFTSPCKILVLQPIESPGGRFPSPEPETNMFATRSIAALALCALAGAQGITNVVPAVVGFVDLSTNGGTPVIPPPSDDSEHNIVTTIGNPLFPAGSVRIGNNGVVI